MRTLLPFLAGCTFGGTAVSSPWLEVQDAAVLDRVTFGVDSYLNIPVANVGTADARIGITTDGPFRVPESLAVVPAADTTSIRVIVRPDSYEEQQGALWLDTGVQRHEVALRFSVNTDADSDGILAIGAGGEDCDDRDASVAPGQPEVCDGKDNDCNDAVDDVAVPPVWYEDSDGDSFGVTESAVATCMPADSYVPVGGDCDDTNADVFPGAAEVWYDGIDQDCDGSSDYDQDGDGYDRLANGGEDCVDSNPAIHPGAVDVCYDGVDQDCDNVDDDDCDQDGWTVDEDCDDANGSVSPSAVEVLDGIDNDCDTLRDEGFAEVGDLVITELLLDASTGSAGQFIELYNASDRDVDLAEVTLRTSSGDGVLSGAVLRGERALVCGGLTQNGGLACTGPLPLPLDDTVLIETDTLLDEVDSRDWAVPVPGASWQLRAGEDHLTNDDEEAWCVSQIAWSGGDLGTPNAPADCP